MEPIRCYCGAPLSNIYDAFRVMKEIWNEQHPHKGTHIDFNMLNPVDETCAHIFTALGLDEKKYCCKTRLNNAVQFHDLEVQDRL